MSDPLAGIPRPPGSPEAISSAGRTHLAAAEQLASGGRRLTSVVNAVAGSLWVGSAAMSAGHSAVGLAVMTGRSADAYRATAGALTRYAAALRSAQAAWDEAHRLGLQAVADEDQERQALQDAAAQAAATGHGPAAHAMLADLGSIVSPLRDRAIAKAQGAVDDARRAGDGAAQAVGSQAAALRPPPPPARPAKAAHWWDHTPVVSSIVDFGSGAVDATWGVGVFLWDRSARLAYDPKGFASSWEDTGKGLAYGVTHPADFGKALIDWKDLSQGHYAHWLGELAPTAAAAFFTGGGAAAAKGVQGVNALDRAGLAAADVSKLSEADALSVISRGAPLVPGSLAPGTAPVLGQEWAHGSLLKNVVREQGNFDKPIEYDFRGSGDLTGVNLHTPDTPLYAPQGRTFKWLTDPKDLLATPSENAARQSWALPDAWDTHAPSTTALPRSEVSIVAVPDGSGWRMAGTAAPQTVYGPAFTGGGKQVLISGVRSDGVLWTGPAPWVSVRDVPWALGQLHPVRGAGTATGVRLPEALQPVPLPARAR